MEFRSYDHTYIQLFDEAPPPSVSHGESDAGIISEGRGFMSAFDLTMQVQVGCPAGCLFCYVPSGPRLTPSEVRGPQGRHWGFEVRNKLRVPQKLSRLLEEGKLADKTLYWSGVTDPYAAPPTLTKELWRVLCATPASLRPRRIAVQTRFRPDRDLALIQRYCSETKSSDQGPAVVISFSIGTDRDDLIRAWEKATPSYEQRMKAIENLRKADLCVVATLSPFGLWHDLQGTLRKFKVWGVTYLTVLFFKEHTGSANTPRLFLAYVRREYPELLDQRWQSARIQEMTEIYGDKRVLIGQEGFSSLTHPHLVSSAHS
ncbi:MAG: radical SAM protein [Deltaproteobacteria bacterium]|nr:radical SAM protein [Deltaproteobacteria bacterium]